MVQKIRTLVSKGFAFIYVYLLHKTKRIKHVNNKKVLIIFGGHIGNAILDMDLLLETKRLFPKEDGWEICILCNERLRKVCETIADMSDYSFLEVPYPYEGGGARFFETYNTIKKMRGLEFEKTIVNVAHIMPLAAYIVAAINSNCSIGVFDDIDHDSIKAKRDIEHNIGNLRWYFERAYTDKIYVPFNLHEMKRQQLIIKRIGGESYKTRIYPIKKLCDYSPIDEPYITISLDSASAQRIWEPEKFATIVNLIHDKYDYSVCFTGGEAANPLYSEAIKHIKNSERTYNLIGKTSFDQWIELLRKSSFHISVDSGSIHVAASVGTQSFCLIGAWNGTRPLPYVIDAPSPETVEPLCIGQAGINELPCYGCVPLKGLMGADNDECRMRVNNGESALCLSKIQPEELFEVIESWVETKHKNQAVI